MLSKLFGSKDSDSPEFQQLVERWDSFLSKIQNRYHEVLKQAEEPLGGIIENLQYDNVIIHNIKTGLHDQAVTQLSRKTDDGWEKMKIEMSRIGVSWDIISQQHKKADELKQWLALEFQKFEVKLFADAARKILDNVKKHIDLNKLHSCTQCAAALPIRIYSFMAVNIKCDSCGSVNTYQPDDRVRALEHYVLNNLAEEHAFPAKLKALSDKNAIKEYYRIYYEYLIENIPEKKEFYERDMHERINNPMFGLGF